MNAIEKQLKLNSLSKHEVKYLPYEQFDKRPKGIYWLVLTDYPVDQSFYDVKGKDKNHTGKFEIYYVDGATCIEIAACGMLGENLNKQNYITGKKGFLSNKITQKKLIGFGFGVERLARVYKQL